MLLSTSGDLSVKSLGLEVLLSTSGEVSVKSLGLEVLLSTFDLSCPIERILSP